MLFRSKKGSHFCHEGDMKPQNSLNIFFGGNKSGINVLVIAEVASSKAETRHSSCSSFVYMILTVVKAGHCLLIVCISFFHLFFSYILGSR